MCKGKGKVEFKICMFPMETVYQIKLKQIESNYEREKKVCNLGGLVQKVLFLSLWAISQNMLAQIVF